MKKRIRGGMLWVACISVVLTVLALVLTFYQASRTNALSLIAQKSRLFSRALNEEADQPAALPTLCAVEANLRFTLIAPDGTVLYDNKADASQMENHLDRPEVQDALASGEGQSQRLSSTVHTVNYYIAKKLPSGLILRVSQSADSMWGVLLKALPVALVSAVCVLLLAMYVSAKLTTRVIAPLNAIDPSADPIETYDELSPFVQAITHQRRQIAEQLDELSHKARTIDEIIGHMQEGLILVDKQGIILAINPSARALFHVETDIVGQHFLSLTRAEPLFLAHQKALDGQSVTLEYETAGRIYQGYFNPAHDDGTLVLFVDATDRLKADKLRRAFTANVSHELKTPLTSISGYAELLSSDIAQAGDRQAFAGKIQQEAARLLLLIEDILLLSNLDEHGAAMEKQPVPLRPVCQEAINALASKAAEQNISLTLSGEDYTIDGNPALLYQLVYNLIDNGIKYNKPGGSVAVALLETDGRPSLIVQDTGIGIARTHQPRLFERFYRVERSRAKNTGGTGLGLSIVKHIALAHNAAITLKSVEHQGTVVQVTF